MLQLHNRYRRVVLLVMSLAGLSSALLAFSLHFSAFALTTTPTTMNFQGRLSSSAGALVPDGFYNMKFALYSVSSGGTALWSETRQNSGSDYRVKVVNGLFSTKLGEVTPLSASLFASGNLYFEITMATPATATCSTAGCASWESPMSPRQQLSTSAYAYNAETLDGYDSSYFAAASGSTNYIQNGTSPQTANLNITGTGTIGAVQTVSVDTATSTALNIGSTNASSIVLGQNTTVASSSNLNIDGGDLQTAGVTRLTSQGEINNITNYTQTSGNFVVNDMASIQQSANTITLGTNTSDGWTSSTFSPSSQYLMSVTSSSDGTKLATAVYSTGYIYTSTDSGTTWTEQAGSGARNWYSIASSSDGTKLAAVELNGYIYTSTDSGVSWTQRTASGSRAWEGIASSSDGTKLVAIDTGGYIYTSTNSGSTWTARMSVGTSNWRSVTSSSDGTKLAASAYGGYIYTSTDSGATWTTRTGAGSRGWLGIASSSDGTKLVGSAYGGYIYTSTDSGATWTEREADASRNWWYVTSNSDGTILAAVTSNAYVYISTNSGVSWVPQTGAGSNAWRAIASNSDGSQMAAVTSTSDSVYIYHPTAVTVRGNMNNNGNISVDGSLQGSIVQSSTALYTPIIRPSGDSTTALQIQNASGSATLMTVDTTNGATTFNTTNSSSGAAVLKFAQSGTVQGTISINGSTVSYNAFTGSHYAKIDSGSLNTYELASLTGGNDYSASSDEPIYGIEKSAISNDPNVLGSFMGLLSGDQSYSLDNPYLVSAAGNGTVWIADNGTGNINIGDPLISSGDVAGYAQRDPGTYNVSHVFAKAAAMVDWSGVTTMVGGVKVAKVSVLYSFYDQNNSGTLLQGTNGYQLNGNLSILGNLTVSGAANFSAINVTNSATFGSLTVAGNSNVQGDLTVSGASHFSNIYVNGHIVSEGVTPTITTGAALGTSVAGASTTVSGTDGAGTISATSASNSYTSGVIAHISFADNYTTDYTVVISPTNVDTANLHIYVVKTATGFDIVSSDTLTASTTYQFSYIVQGVKLGQ